MVSCRIFLQCRDRACDYSDRNSEQKRRQIDEQRYGNLPGKNLEGGDTRFDLY